MFAKLSSFVGGGITLPFDLGEPHPLAWGQWTHYQGTLKADGSNCSVFRISALNKEDPKLRAARNGVKRLRTLRHPNVLAFKETVETEERGETVIYIVTEAVSPLVPTIRGLGLSGPQRDQYLSMGLNQVVSALSFLNNDCKLLHGNVCASAIVVTDALDWRLHGFDLVTEHEWPAGFGTEIPLTAASWMVGAQYKPAEVAKGDWEAVREAPAWSVDAWGLGCLIQEVYSGNPLARTEDLRHTERIPQNILPYYQKLLASTASRRLNPEKILEAGVLKSKLGDTMTFIENLALKDSVERDTFFKRLPSVLPSIPEAVAQRKLLPLLAAALEFGGAPPLALGTLLTIGETMSEEDRAKQVIPILSKLFASNDRGIRRSLLENIASFGANLPSDLVENQIYANVQTGFVDANPYLRELTLKSMIILGPKLSQKTLNQSLLKHLAKLQVDEEPAIRANTTVLLGNIASQLSESTCKKVLLNAFTRALKDPFPPARAAGLRAVLATATYHGPEDVAARVVPMVGPLCIDPVQEVRVSALQCLEHFLKTLQDHSKVIEQRAAVAGEAAGSAAGSGVAGASGSLLTGFGWAVSSLVSKGGPVVENTPPPAAAARPAEPSNLNPPPAVAAAASNGPSFSPARTSSRPHSGGYSSQSNQGWDEEEVDVAAASSRGGMEPAAADGGDSGWDDEDPLEDMMDAVAAEMEARKKLARVTVGSSRSGATGRTAGAGARARPPARAAAGAGRQAGGGMKLGVKKLAKEEAEEFADW